MPTRDEDGNIIGLDGFPIALRGDDAREFILPGSIPESKFDLTAASDDPEEHDCLPPLEHTGSWVLSEKAVQSIIKALQRIIPVANSLNEDFVQLRKFGLSSRNHRKAKRWDEKNRRRRLKGLPEKECPYPRIWKACIIKRLPEADD